MRLLRPLLAGLAAAAWMHVYRSPPTSKPVSRAGWPYAIFCTMIVAAWTTFSRGRGARRAARP